MRKAVRYRLYPTPDQETTLVGWIGQLRFVWNHLCGHRQNMPIGKDIFDCEGCEYVGDRDVNAAINIRNEGIDMINRAGIARIYACGDTSDGIHSSEWISHVSLKQEQVLGEFLQEAPIPF